MKKNDYKIANKDEQQINWAQLEDDLLVEIMNRLYLFSDQVRFRAVCKNWLQAIDQCNNNIVSLPWVIETAITHGYIHCYIYEPSSSNITRPILVYKISLHKVDLFPYINYVPVVKHITQKFGWIFSSIEFHHLSFLLFSPLTKKEIMLPRLAYSHDHQLLTQAFSTKPDSPDCVFLVLYHCKSRSTIIVNVYRHGDKEWRTREFDNVRGFYSSRLYIMPVYIEGIFYIVFPVMKLLTSYNIALGEFKVDSGFVDNSVTDDPGFYEAFELNGELMLIGIFKDNGFIQMFDRSTKAWVPLKSLGDHSIFISYDSLLLVPAIGMEGISNCLVLPNKIYFCSWWHGVYLFEGGKLVKFSGESIIAKWYKANVVNCRYWIAPADDLLKRKERRNSLKNLGPQTMLPVVTEQQLSKEEDDLIDCPRL